MSTDDSQQSQSEGAERSIDLSSLFQGLQGEGMNKESGSPNVSGLGSLLAGLIGQGMPDAGSAGQPDLNDAGLAEGVGISPSVAQAAMALVMGSLLRGGSGEGAEGGGLVGMLRQSGDQPLDEEAVKATGLPEQLSRNTGLDLPKAMQTVQQILEMLRKATKPLGSAGASTTVARKKRKKASGSTRPKAKPKDASTSTPPKRKTAAKPKKTSSSTRPKAKPKKASGSTTTKRRKPTSSRKPAE